jgi:radical SAM superfamily enzyme YgiQ (UPF0313 family)
LGSAHRIALINPPDIRPSVRPNESHAPPLGLASIAAFLREHGYQCDLFDLAAQHPVSKDALSRVGFFDYDVYGFTSYTKTFLAAEHLSSLVRKECPEAAIVFGGPHVSADAPQILRRYRHIDAIIRNEGEVPMLILARYLADASGEITDIPNLVYSQKFAKRIGANDTPTDISVNALLHNLPPLDSLPAPLRTYKIEPPRTAIETRGNAPQRIEFLTSSRGCPKKCSFCSIIVMSPKYRVRSISLLMKEVQELYAQKQFGHISFHDANFFADWRRALALSKALYEWNPNITWAGTATVDTVVRQPEAIHEVGSLNCLALEVGIENGSDKVLKRLNKGITVEQCLEAVRIISDAGIHLDLDYIMFDSEMTQGELIENREFLIEADLQDYSPFDHLRNAVRLYPGTALRKATIERFGLNEVQLEQSLITPFVNEEVAGVYRELNSFLKTHGEDIHKLVGRLDAAARDFNQQNRYREAQNLYKVAIELRNLPFKLFSELIETSTRGNPFAEDCRRTIEERLSAILSSLDGNRTRREYRNGRATGAARMA